MQLETKIMDDLKTAMKAKDQAAMRGIRAIKSAIQLARTDGSGLAITPELEVKMLQKLIKQRQDSLAIFEQQNREDLAVTEREEIAIIQRYLPAQLGAEELEARLRDIIQSTGAQGIRDMGKVMAAATQALGGQADGKTISATVKALLG
jgi:uncharacterized protein YqeY